MDVRSPWHVWAVEQLQACSEKAPLHVNLVIYTELLVPGPDVDALDGLLDVYQTQRSALPWNCAGRAAKAFGMHGRRGGARLRPLPDFFISAHAAVANLSLPTRDGQHAGDAGFSQRSCTLMQRHATAFPRELRAIESRLRCAYRFPPSVSGARWSLRTAGSRIRRTAADGLMRLDVFRRPARTARGHARSVAARRAAVGGPVASTWRLPCAQRRARRAVRRAARARHTRL